MPVTAASLVVKVAVDGDADVKSKLASMSSTVKETQGGFKSALSGALSFAAGLGIFNLASQAVGFLKDQFVGSIQAAETHQTVMSQTTQAIKSTGDASKMTVVALSNLADSLSRVTTFSDDTVQSGENLLLTFTGIGKDVFPAATKTMLDLSQAMGQDVKSSAIQLGKALNDPLTGMTALTRVGVTFDDGEKKAIKTMMAHNDVVGAQNVMLKELQKEFGGSAEAAGKTFAGQMQILTNTMDDFKQKVGTAILPLLSQFIGWVTSVALPHLEAFSDWFTKTAVPKIQYFQDILSQIGDSQGFDDLVKSFNHLGESLGKLFPYLKNFGEKLKGIFSENSIIDGANRIMSIMSSMSGIINGVANAVSGLPSLFAKIQSTLAPVGAFPGSVFAPLWKELVAVWNTQLKPAWDNLVKAFAPAIPVFQAIAALLGAVLVGAIAGLIQGIANLLSGWAQMIGGIVQIISGVITIVLGIIDAFVALATGNFSAFGDALSSIWSGVVEIFQGLGNTLMGFFGGLFMGIWGLVSGFVTGFIGFFQMLYDELVGHSIVPDMINGIINWFQQLPSRALAAVQGLLGNMSGFFGNIASQAITWGSNIVSSIASGITNAIGNVGAAIGQVTQYISDHLPHSPAKIGPLRELASQGKEIANQVGQGLLSGIPTLQNALGSLTKPIAATLNVSSPTFANGVIFPSQSQMQPQIIVQPTPIYLDGRNLANGMMPYIVDVIRGNIAPHGRL